MKFLRYSLFFMVYLSSQSLFAQSSPTQAQICAGCHGNNGVSNNPLWPNLSGQKKQYLIKQLKDFKTKNRKDPLMSPVAETLSDSDIEIVADYFSTLKQP